MSQQPPTPAATNLSASAPIEAEVTCRRHFTDDEKAFLKPFVDEYANANREGQKELLGNRVLVQFLDKFYPGIKGND